MPFWSRKGSKTKAADRSKPVDKPESVSREEECREKYNYARNRCRRLVPTDTAYKTSLGILILQHLHRLQLLGSLASERLRRHGETLTKVNDSTPPPPAYSKPAVQEHPHLKAEVIELRRDYWKHQLRLQDEYRQRPHPTSPRMELFLVGHEYKNQYGQPYEFVDSQQECANAGGCCARSCGCCQRGLYAIEAKKDRTSPVYGHCTLECACCIQFRECYVPDERLSPPKTKPLLR
ncbi:uncharacterized protein BO66DRAFT_468427 [Aspergillus aculeatinus CBS 121060]|uniref:Uncharacterized protein n=1 Tax=Aspergillus aculeatinus CBS 121060 TaxID=1448322 RepID=A0ACD1HKI7_9EURO|nr:hypothetical protein BO66DRAFT_468427 [Aspergillus aculeatinus CBS 121060]RAH74031.1 hypothetical protein BO66DRAFT_468427 [Aspergillus aculeatinus CBS 121060]